MGKGGFRGGMQRGGMPGGSQMQAIKQAQKMQQELLKMQQELESREFTATAGGGAVKATLLGTREFKSIEIDPDCVDPEDVEMLQDMVLAAVNEALRTCDDVTGKSMDKVQGGMGLPF